jgi:hypothetical protein
MLTNSKLCLFLALLVTFGLVIQTNADTLFNGKTPEKIGHGSKNGKTITWKDCDGKNQSDYVDPPFSFRQADNCTVGPPTFGLQCEGEKCTVVDEQKIREYLPDASLGEKMTLRITDKLVELQHDGATLRIGR